MTNKLWHFLNLWSGMALSLLYVDPPQSCAQQQSLLHQLLDTFWGYHSITNRRVMVLAKRKERTKE